MGVPENIGRAGQGGDRTPPRPQGWRRAVPAPARRGLRVLITPELQLRIENSRFQRRHRDLASGRVLVPVAGRLRIAERRADLSPLQLWRDTLDLVCRALEEAGVGYFCVRPVEPTMSAVAVSAADRGRAVAALAAATAAADAYAGPLKDADGSRAGLGAKAWERVADRDLIRITRHHCAPDGSLSLGPEHSCVVEFWRPEGDELVAPRANRITDRLPAHGAPVRTGADRLTPMAGPDDGEPRYRTRAEFLLPLVDDITFPIDVVYTWVDGDDPAWRARRDLALAEVGEAGLNHLAANDSRYISRDELRYSLRSLAAYAPWVRHIYIVTDDQVPRWLNLASPRITVVDHKEIFQGRGVLPTFNSHAIESQLHHIEGLSEHFLYLNDDVFLGRTLCPDRFFHPNGTTKFFPSAKRLDLRERSAEDQPAMAAGKNTRRIIEQTFGTVPAQRLKHTPHALRRSVLAEIEQRYAAECAQTARSRFRHPDDLSIPSSLHHYYSFLSGRAVEADMEYRYIDLARPDAADRMRAALAERSYDCFCVNDTEAGAESESSLLEMTERFLQAYFPVPGPYEIG
ncbi:stealth family protein [Actinomadura macrotermitis]|uniref:Exopolysaccharide phosphotransferase CpsY n=1 Tax=Actinomadura macrotermitis TaxID=2585200 RepID=A0A7K0C7A8_9ACTN|nr:stealth family protein [Actinomadura macrotermitis]MQY09323.1 Exopolysaccharide phosphotransferase CpsY [Actinomadura macrotermitis]